MTIGLNQKELVKLSFFATGNTEEEFSANLWGSNCPTNNAETIARLVEMLQNKMVEITLANNKRIEEQLASTGLHLPD